MSYSQLILPETPYGIWELSTNSPIDLTGRNNATAVGGTFQKKPIIYGLDGSVVLDENSTITISNIYKLFLTGAEDKSATIEFFFNIPNSDDEEVDLLSIGDFARCYVLSDRIYLEANGETCNVLTETWDRTNYVAIIYKKGSVSLQFNARTIQSISLPDSYQFPNASAPSLVFGPASDAAPVYLNQIVLYSYALTPQQSLSRLNFSRFSGNSDRISTSIAASIINPQYKKELEIISSRLSDRKNFESGTLNNVIVENDYLTLRRIPPVSVSSTTSVIDYHINANGISFDNQSYISIGSSNIPFSGINNSITLSILLDGLSTNQTIFEYGPGLDYSSISLLKTDSNTIAIIKKDTYDNESVLLESSNLGQDFSLFFNIAVLFYNNKIELLVNDISQGVEDISIILSPLSFYIGNSFNTSSPLTSKIKNFTIDNYTEKTTSIVLSEIEYQNEYVDEYSEEINSYVEPKIFSYANIGLYTLSFQDTFNVSQYGTWTFYYPSVPNSVGNSVTFNYGSKNCILSVNNKEITQSSFIPDYDYENNNSIEISAKLKTNDSLTRLPIFDDLFLVSYDTMDITSSGGKYILTSIPDEDNSPYNNVQPYLLSDIFANPLDRPQNLGCKFIRSIENIGDAYDNPTGGFTPDSNIKISSGGRIVINSESDTIKTIEFLFKLESMPISTQEFCLFNVDRSANESLSINSSGIIKSGNYNLYIDGVLTNTMSNLDVNEFYYVAIVFNTNVSEDIYLGINKNLQNMMNGSIGNIIINDELPSNFIDYIDYRFTAMKGRNKISISDSDSIAISDEFTGQQTYITSLDNSVFAMTQLPKIRIVQNRWETIQ